MKLKSAKGYIIGAIAGASLMFSLQSFAEDGLTQIQSIVYLRTGLSITLDGKKAQLDNPAIIYEGSTYIKLRDAGKLTGTDVNWNADTGTIEMKSVLGVSAGDVSSGASTTLPAPTLEPTSTDPPLASDPKDRVPTHDDSYLGTITTNLTTPTNADNLVFILLTDLDSDLGNHFIKQAIITYKDGVEILQFADNSIPTSKGINIFYDTNTGKIYLSRSILMNFFTTGYLSQFDKYSVDFNSKTLTKI
jgi:hypothetical protein